jgi:hypothetical protein
MLDKRSITLCYLDPVSILFAVEYDKRCQYLMDINSTVVMFKAQSLRG